MKLPADALIAPAKINRYLLVPQRRNDKAQWLGSAGYRLDEWTRLRDDLREQILPLEATYVEETSFGTTYEIAASLQGPNGKTLAVRTIWMRERETGVVKFITMYPDKRESAP